MPLLLFALVAVYPFIERWLSKDRERHNLLQWPRGAPIRPNIGTTAIAFYAILPLASIDDFLAVVFKVPVTAIVWVGKIAALVVPVLVFVTYSLCVRLQRADRDMLTHGVSTGLIELHEDGYFVEVRQRLHTEAEDDPPARATREQGAETAEPADHRVGTRTESLAEPNRHGGSG